MNSITRFIAQLIMMSIIAYGIHYASQFIFDVDERWEAATYTLIQLYFVPFLLSLVMIFGVFAAGRLASKNIGFAFLGLMTVKTIASYFFIAPVFDQGAAGMFIRNHFLIVFLVYLAFDVYVTYVLLNQSDDTKNNDAKKVR